MRQLMKEIILPIAVAIALAFVIQAALAKPYEIPTGSMIPTIQEHDRIIANRVVYLFREPERGDIIVFNPSDDARRSCSGDVRSDVPFVKRVIGLPGDTVRVTRNVAIVNGRRFEVPGAVVSDGDDLPDNDNGNANFPAAGNQPLTVPDGKLFVLGDNRIDSCDARSWTVRGPETTTPSPFVDRNKVIGQAEVVYWPPRHLTFLGGSPRFVGPDEPAG